MRHLYDSVISDSSFNTFPHSIEGGHLFTKLIRTTNCNQPKKKKTNEQKKKKTPHEEVLIQICDSICRNPLVVQPTIA